MNNRISLKDLALFVLVSRCSSFAEAARQEGASPAFVSKRIAVLEDALGVRLFHRTTRTVALTVEGEALIRSAQTVVEEVKGMADLTAGTRGTPRGPLRISSSAGFGRRKLAPALSELTRVYPLLRLQLEILDRPVDLIGEGFDLDVRVGGQRELNLVALPLARNARVICAAPAYLAKREIPRTLDDLANHRCIGLRERDRSFSLWRLRGPRGVETVRIDPELSSNNGEIVRQWGLEGHGIFLRALWDVREDLRAGHLVRLLPEYREDADVAAVYPQRLEQTNRLRACVHFLKSWFATHPLDADEREPAPFLGS